MSREPVYFTSDGVVHPSGADGGIYLNGSTRIIDHKGVAHLELGALGALIVASASVSEADIQRITGSRFRSRNDPVTSPVERVYIFRGTLTTYVPSEDRFVDDRVVESNLGAPRWPLEKCTAGIFSTVPTSEESEDCIDTIFEELILGTDHSDEAIKERILAIRDGAYLRARDGRDYQLRRTLEAGKAGRQAGIADALGNGL